MGSASSDVSSEGRNPLIDDEQYSRITSKDLVTSLNYKNDADDILTNQGREIREGSIDKKMPPSIGVSLKILGSHRSSRPQRCAKIPNEWPVSNFMKST